MTTKTKAGTNGSAPTEDKVGLTPEFVAKTIVLDDFAPSFGDMADMEEAFGSLADLFVASAMADGSVQNRATAKGMWATAWAAIHRVLPDVTPDDVRHLSPVDFAQKAEDAGQAQG